ncbi:MAG: hypothetical protein HWE18_01655 [Gammaproteobacteria bacterium]|nr:hypothetical protein [Gammaproteobacteria bacterium]
MKLLLGIVLAMCAFFVNASDHFMPIDLEGNFQDVGVQATASSLSNIVTLELENLSSESLSCKSVFHSGPELDAVRRVVLESGDERILSVKFFRHVIRLKITLDCEKTS